MILNLVSSKKGNPWPEFSGDDTDEGGKGLETSRSSELTRLKQKKEGCSPPGSRTPRCPVTGDDVTDTPGKT